MKGTIYPYLFLREEYYYFRISIPKKYQDVLGRKEYKKALQTRDTHFARRKCWRMGEAAMSFFEMMEKSAMYFVLNDENIKKLVRNHFEKRLLDAAEDYIFYTETIRDDIAGGGYDPENIAILFRESQEKLARYTKLKQQHNFDFEQKNIAQELLEYWKAENDPAYDNHEIRATSFARLCLDLTRAHYESERMIHANLAAEHANVRIEDPYFQDCRNFFEVSDPDIYMAYRGKPYYREIVSISLSQAFDKYYKSKIGTADFQKRSKNSISEYRGFFERLFDIWGEDKDLGLISKSDALDLKDYLMRFPKHFTNNFGKQDIDLLSVLKGEHGNYDTISPSQAKKMWDAYKDFFVWAKERNYVQEHPFKEIIFKGKRHSQDDRYPFTTDELMTLFTSALYTGRKNKVAALWVPAETPSPEYVIKDGYFWMPLIALYSGMRSGEILQLSHEHFKRIDDICYFDIDHMNLKTPHSRRIVPVHPELIKIGFLNYIEQRLKYDPKGYILDSIPRPDKQRISNKYSNKFSEYAERIGIKSNKNSFHSLRHNFEDAMVLAQVSERTQFAVAGHSSNRREWMTNYAYGQNNITEIHREIAKVKYKNLDLSHLYIS